MTNTLTLNKTSYPLMMHLSILPKHDSTLVESTYDARTQTSDITGMAGSWCSRKSSTGGVLRESDDDSQEDD